MLATVFGHNDYRVLVTDVDLAGAEQVSSMIDPLGQRAHALQVDVSNREDFELALSTANEAFGGVSVLINNAAVTKTTPVFEITQQEFDEVLAINLGGVFSGCQVFGSAFKAQGYGRIVNIASLAGQHGGTATGAHYAASKGAVITLTKVFARELAASGVTVNAISPGPLDVPLVHELLPADTLQGLISAIPTGELGKPQFIAQIALLLASPEATSITGATIDANSGLYVR